jgi:hypothetical protein
MRAPDVGDLPVKKGEGFNMVGFLGYPLLIVSLPPATKNRLTQAPALVIRPDGP